MKREGETNKRKKYRRPKRGKEIREMQMSLLLVVAILLFSTASGDHDDEDAQIEFLLPYSETEDVDFHLARPAGSGCYQW